MSTPRKSFVTKTGLELPLLNLKGREYLMAAFRIQWFRSENPTGVIKTAMIEHNGEGQDEYAIFKTEVYMDTDRGPMLVATAHKRESRKDFPDFIEKAETSSLSRALSLCGYGTQFTGDELDEGTRLADAPIEVMSKTASTATTSSDATDVTAKKSSFRKRVESASATNGAANGSDL